MDGQRSRLRVIKERTNTVNSPFRVSMKPIMDIPSTPNLQKLPTDVITVQEAELEDALTDLPLQVGAQPSRRISRYLSAEQDLSQSLQRCHQESPVQELQNAALTKFRSMLADHVTESREQLDKLRKLLADRATEPILYRAAQRDRWMEERRLLAAEELSKVLERHLSTLSSQPPGPTTAAMSSPPPASHEANSPNSTREANLMRFFKSTSRQRNFSRNRARCRVTVALRPRSDKGLELPRIHDHRQPLPLLLREAKPEQRLPWFQIPSKPVTSPSAVRRPTTPTSPMQSSLTSSSSGPSSSSPATSHIQSPLSPISEPSPSHQLSTPFLGNKSDGVAVIWTTSPRSAEEILADTEMVVDIPDYVSDLLAGFDSISTPDSVIMPPPVDPSPKRSASRPTGSQDHSLSSSKVHLTRNILNRQGTHGAPRAAPPSSLHKSPSRKRISAIFSLPEALSSRRGIGIDAASRSKRLSTAIAEESDSSRPVSVSFADIPSIDSGSVESTHRKVNDGQAEKMLKKLRRRMSALGRS